MGSKHEFENMEYSLHYLHDSTCIVCHEHVVTVAWNAWLNSCPIQGSIFSQARCSNEVVGSPWLLLSGCIEHQFYPHRKIKTYHKHQLVMSHEARPTAYLTSIIVTSMSVYTARVGRLPIWQVWTKSNVGPY